MTKFKRAQQTSHLFSARSVLAYSIILLTSTRSTTAQSQPPECSCYLVSGPQPGYFKHHYFIDFRDLNSTLSADATANTTTPSTIPSTATTGNEPFTNDFFTTSPSWTSFWSINNNTGLYTWNDGSTVQQVASPQNIWISPPSADRDSDGDSDSSTNNTHLTLRTSRNTAFQSVAELDSLETSMQYLSLRARVRILAQNNSLGAQSSVDEGAVLGLFTYESDTQESDLEILTREDSRTVRCSNQPDVDAKTGDEIAGASEAVQLPEGSRWTQWTDIRVDWFKGQSRWWANGTELRNSTKNVPSKPSGVVLNLWSDGGSWSGNMTVGGEVLVGVEWIEVVYNVTSDSSKGQCGLGCWVDGADVKAVGTPALAFNSTDSQGAGMRVAVSSDSWIILGTAVAGSALLALL